MPDYHLTHAAGRTHDVPADAQRDLDLAAAPGGGYHLVHEGRGYACEVVAVDLPARTITVAVDGRAFEFAVADEVDRLVAELGLGAADAAADKDVHAPMPGLVLEVLVRPGDVVEAGTQLLVLEAMKMENSLLAESAGTVAEVAVAEGDAVEKRQLLITLA